MTEVLVSVCVVSIGLLCAAGMQLVALRTTQQSALQTSAMYLAVDMANQIRATLNVNKWSDEQNPYLAFDYKAGATMEKNNAVCQTGKEECDAEHLALLSISEWENRIKENLPKGRGLICRDSNPWDAEEGRYKWACSSLPNEDAPLVIKLGWHEKKMAQMKSQNTEQHDAPSVVLLVGG